MTLNSGDTAPDVTADPSTGKISRQGWITGGRTILPGSIGGAEARAPFPQGRPAVRPGLRRTTV